MQEVDEVIYSDLFIGGPLAGQRIKVHDDIHQYQAMMRSKYSYNDVQMPAQQVEYTDVLYIRVPIRSISRRIYVWAPKGADVFDELLKHYKP